jgi:hypothetical protein
MVLSDDDIHAAAIRHLGEKQITVEQGEAGR